MATTKAQKWSEAKATRSAELMATYRRFVHEIANDKEISQKDASDLGEVLLLLDLGDEQFEHDVATLKRLAKMKDEYGDLDEQYQAIKSEWQRIGKAIDAANAELNRLRGEHKTKLHAMGINSTKKATLEQIQVQNPRLFAANVADAVKLRHERTEHEQPLYARPVLTR